MKKVMTIHNKVIRENIKKYKGFEVKTHLDCFMIAFQCPLDAVACCTAIQKELVVCEWTSDTMAFPDMQSIVWNGQVIYKGPRVRMGMHFGQDIDAQFDPTTKRYDYYGTTVNKASRIEKVSSGGRVYISAETYQSIKNIALQEFKPLLTRKLSTSNLESYSTLSFKQSVVKGEIVFENIGERELKGLEGKHAVYWVKDLSNLRYAYIEQFEMSQRPPSLIGLTIPVAIIDPSDKEKYEIYQAISNCLYDPSKMTLEEKAILLQRLILFPKEKERNRWTTHPNTSLLKYVSNFLLNYSLIGYGSPQLGQMRKPPPSPRTPRRLMEMFSINQ